MKKLLPILIINIVVLSGLGAGVSTTIVESNVVELSTTIDFSEPEISDEGKYHTVSVANTNSLVNDPGAPLLPAYRETFIFPTGTIITDIVVTYSEPQETILTKPVLPAVQPIPLSVANPVEVMREMNPDIYTSYDLYPQESYQQYIGSGLDGTQRVIYTTVICYPVRYNPGANTLYTSDSAEITIHYEHSHTPSSFSEEYDLVVIAPAIFEQDLTPLVEHKNLYNVRTLFKSCEEIYTEYTGVDKPEQIKYFIKDAYDQWNITYVLLVGGLNSMIFAQPRDDDNQGSEDWYVPVRYTNLYDGGGLQDPGYISDLYYADLYDGEGNFSSWDPNGDGIFAAWGRIGIPKDTIDLYPDVIVGRLACRNKFEVKNMVKKIITYESTTPESKPWFETMVVIGGDTFDDVSSTNFYEGEVENQKSLDYMTNFTPVKIWASHRGTDDPVPIPRDILKLVSQGCGFLAFAGHGSPERWNTYWPEGFDEDRVKGLWYFNMPFFYNRDKLPICVVGGCHNSQFNVTATGFLFGAPWVYGPVPECFSWLLTRKYGGGVIAALGNTGLGYGAVGESGDLDGDGNNEPDCIETLGGYLETQFFKAYGVDGKDVLGETWCQAVNTYLTVFPGMADLLDCKTVEQWPLLGDPSLQIGGYP